MLATIAQAASTGTPQKIATPTVAWKALAPVLILIGGAVVILGISAMVRRKPRSSVFAFLTVITALGAIAARCRCGATSLTRRTVPTPR